VFAVSRNAEFFRAPFSGIVCIHPDLCPDGSRGVGMLLQRSRPASRVRQLDSKYPRDRSTTSMSRRLVSASSARSVTLTTFH